MGWVGRGLLHESDTLHPQAPVKLATGNDSVNSDRTWIHPSCWNKQISLLCTLRKKDYPKYLRTKRSKLLCSNHAWVQIIVTQGRAVKLLTLSLLPCYIDLVWDTRETTSLFLKEQGIKSSASWSMLVCSFHIHVLYMYSWVGWIGWDNQ